MATDEDETFEADDGEDLEIDSLEELEELEDDDDDDDEDDLAVADEFDADDDADDGDEEEADDEVEDDEEEADDEVEDEEEDDEAEESLDVLLTREKVLDDDDLGRDDAREGVTATLPIGEGEFTCRSCFLVKRRAQLADAERLICFDCA